MSKSKMIPPEVTEFFRAIGKANGAKGGRAAAANMTKAERKRRALKAVLAREAKRKGRAA